MSAETTIAKLRTIFATHGLPEQLVSDNGSGFTSAQFRLHGPQWNQAYPNLHPSSNGLAKREVQTFKSTVSKLEGSIDVRLAHFLLTYRVMPQTMTNRHLTSLKLLCFVKLHCVVKYQQL